jgi:hypothetical protein
VAARESIGTAPPPDLSRLEARLDEMMARLAGMTGASSSAVAPASLGATDGSTLAALYASLPDEKHRAYDIEASSPHFGRPLSSWLAAYGAPDHVNTVNSSLVLEYDFDDRRAISVSCVQGLVMSVISTKSADLRELEQMESNVRSLGARLDSASGDDRESFLQSKAHFEREIEKLKARMAKRSQGRQD